jgi:hypothetical protein
VVFSNSLVQLNGEFKSSDDVKFIITPPTGIYYIKTISLKKQYNKSTEISIDSISSSINIRTAYKYFKEENLENASNESELNYYESNVLKYDIFKPIYNDVIRIRSITIKESNYFNILQTIAETFGVWMDIEVNAEGKFIKFKNFCGTK